MQNNTNSIQNIKQTIPSHLALAVISFFLFWIIGIVAIVYAARVSSLVAAGDIEGAKLSSNKAKKWGWAGIIIYLVFMAIYILLIIVGAISVDSTSR